MLSYVKKYKWMYIRCMFLKLVGTIIELLLPYVLEHIVDYAAPSKDIGLIIFWGLIMLFTALMSALTNISSNRMSVKSAELTTYDIRKDLFWRSLNLSGNQVDEFGLPSLTSRMTSDSYNVQNFLQSAQTMLIRSPFMLLGGIAVTLTMDTGLALILCVIVPVMAVFVIGISLIGVPLYDKVQQSVDDIVRIMRENITGIRVVKALSKEKHEMDRFEEVNETMNRRDIKASMIMALPGPVLTMVLNLSLVVVVIVGAYRVNLGLTKPGVILAFLTYFNMMLMGVNGLNRIFMTMSKANASANRIAAVVEQPDELTAIPEDKAAHTDSEDFVIFDNVSFSYGSELTENQEINMSLKDISFSIPKGGSLGIIGATGCGKTTIVNLLMRFYDTTKGHIFVDGKDVRTYTLDDLRRKFGVVFQNDALFANTLAENISFGRDVGEEDISGAVSDAMAAEFVEQYEDGYKHELAIRGANLSGGHKQRILIARALAAHPDILILDDSSSALDYKTDASLRKVIRENYKETTTIIIAQRVSSIMNLDDIIMLDEGEIIGHGTHDELMESCEQYREIYETQMGEGR